MDKCKQLQTTEIYVETWKEKTTREREREFTIIRELQWI